MAGDARKHPGMKGKTYYLLVGTQTVTATVKNSLEVLQNDENPAVPFFDSIAYCRDSSSFMLMTAIFIVA